MITKYPLKWPPEEKLRGSHRKSPFRIKKKLIRAIAELEQAVDKIKGKEAILYTNMKFDSVGEPIEPKYKINPGACLVFNTRENHLVFFCDKYHYLSCNIRSITETILSYHKIKTYGTKYRSHTHSFC